jgi:uncharacterized protein (TIGR00369 family)
MEDFSDNRSCFVCGEKNPIGLKLKFRADVSSGTTEADLTFAAHFQGWEKIVHGGLLATVLDEALIYAAGAKGHHCVTGEITVRYIKPVPTGVPLRLRGRFVEDKGRIVLAESAILGDGDTELAKATGKLFKITRPAS